MWLYNCLVRSFVVTSLTYISARADGSWKIGVPCSGRWIAKYAINSILCHQHITCVACMLVLPQMCLVSSAGDENECGQGAAHTAPNHRGEARYSRQPDTAEMKLKGDMTDTGWRTYFATTKKSCQFIHYIFEIWIKTFTIFINKNFSAIRNSWQNTQQQFLKMTSFPLCSCHNSVSVARVAAHWVPALPITDHRADVPCCQRMSDLSMSLV